MWKKISLAIIASSLSTLSIMWVYKNFYKVEKTPPFLRTQFVYRELPNDILAQFNEMSIKNTEISDPVLDEYIAEKDKLVSEKASLIELNAISSKIFRYQLTLIKKKISDQHILNLATQLNQTTQEYLQKILETKNTSLTPEELKKELQQLGITEKEDSFKKIKKILENKKIQRLLDEEVDQAFYKNPILVNLKPPQFEMEIKNDWTPHWGQEKSGTTLMAFVDFSTQSSQILNKSLLALSQKYPQLKVYWRPYFTNKEDPMQRLLAEATLCLWHQKQDAFFYILYTLEFIKHDSTETDLYQLAGKNNFNVEELKKCLVQGRYKSVVDYHLKYGDYLGIKTLPVIFLNGEVITGEFREENLEKLLLTYTTSDH